MGRKALIIIFTIILGVNVEYFLLRNNWEIFPQVMNCVLLLGVGAVLIPQEWGRDTALGAMCWLLGLGLGHCLQDLLSNMIIGMMDMGAILVSAIALVVLNQKGHTSK